MEVFSFSAFSTFALLFITVFSANLASAEEYQDEIERDFPLRSFGSLQLTNLRGGVTVQGWTQDKIRVRARRTVIADTPEASKSLLSALDFRYHVTSGDVELAAEYGQGLGIEERLKERKQPRTRMEMLV